MAVITNTRRTDSAVGNREQLHDVVNNIDPEDTPIYSDIGKTTFTGKHPEWETIAFRAPSDNAREEGEEYTIDAQTAPVRLGTYTQIMRATGRTSGTQEAENNAGRAEQLKEAKMRAGVEVRQDVEYAMLSPTASQAGLTRRFGGIPTWVESNVSRGGGGANGGYNAGTQVTTAPTNGTQRAFSKTIADNVIQQGFTNGAKFKNVYGSPYVKSVFVTFMSDSNVAQFRKEASNSMTIHGDAEMYISPHGMITFKTNRIMAESASLARNVIFVDPEYLDFGWLRRIKEDKKFAMTKLGDAEQFAIIGEGAMKTKNEKGLGIAADVFGLTASS